MIPYPIIDISINEVTSSYINKPKDERKVVRNQGGVVEIIRDNLTWGVERLS